MGALDDWEELPSPVELPCGCILSTTLIDGEPALIVTACAQGRECSWVQYIAAETERQHGHRVTYIGGDS